MTAELVVLMVGNLLLMAGGGAALGLGESYIPRVLRDRGGQPRGGGVAAAVMAVGLMIGAVYVAIAALVVRFGIIGFKEHVAPFMGRGYGRQGRHLILASLFVSCVMALYIPVFFHQRIRRARRRERGGAPR